MSEISYVVRRARGDDAEEVFSLVKDFPPEAIPDRQVFLATFAALADTAGSVLFVAVVASNLRRIATFFTDEALRIQEMSETAHARCRKNELGQPLARPEPPAPPGTSA
jgi:hypothetical protein